MKLLVDVGNTRAKAVLSHHGRLEKVRFDLSLFEHYPIDQLVYAAVRDDEQVIELLDQASIHGAQVTSVQTAKEAFGVHCAYPNFETLGIDRWLSVLGGVKEYPNQNLIIVDAGTATTVDFVTDEKLHLGGWIVPGLKLMTSAIADKAQKVFDGNQADYTDQIGTNTPQALKSGCLAAQLGLIQHAIDYFDRPAQLILLGGSATVIMSQLALSNTFYHDPLLVFKGMDLF